MAHVSEINDPEIRAMLERARQEMRQGRTAVAVRSCADAFLRLVDLQPGELDRLAPYEGRHSPDTAHWPDYGTHLVREGEGGRPEVVFDRERFALTEAIAYMEFVIGRAVALGL
jgi:hypothetical protein